MKTKKGFALVTAMGLLLICTLFTVALLSVSTGSYRMSVVRRDSDKAFNIAEGGLQHAMRKLEQNPKYGGENNIALGQGKFDVKLEKLSAPNYYRLVSNGKLDSLEGRTVEKRVSAVVEITDRLPVWDYAMVARKKLQFQKEVVLDSAPVANQGHIHSNRDLMLHKESTVMGRATAVRKLDLKAGATATDGTARTAAVEFPQLDWDKVKKQAAGYGTMSGNQIADGDETITLRGLVTGSVRTRGKGKVVIDGLVWVTGRVHLEGLSLAGEGTVIAEGGVMLGTNSAETGLAARPVIFVTPGNQGVMVKHGCTLSVGIYAPNGKVTLDGDCQIFGSVAGEMIHVKGNAHITRNTGMGDSGLGTFVVPHYWQEL